MRYQTLQIFRPTISKNVTQGWAENRACLGPNGKIFGVAKACPAGSPSFYQSIGMLGHNGEDIAGLSGEDIYHAASFSGWWHTEVDRGGGIGVDVVSNEPLFFPMPIPTELINSAIPHEQDGKQGFTHHVKMRYWHLKAPVGFEKKQVTVGTVIGLMGNTGASSGVHLHYSPKWCLKDGRGVGQSNGFNGAFDHRPFIVDFDVTAKDHARYIKESPLPLTAVEIKDMEKQLNMIEGLLIALQKLTHKI